MFTGLIEGLGQVIENRPVSEGIRLVISSQFPLTDARLGDSIAINGTCLTVVEIVKDTFSVDVSRETLSRAGIGRLATGSKVNLERALLSNGRLDGHIVLGHVDAMGMVEEITKLPKSSVIKVSVPLDVSRYIVEKGSIAVDGISLTVNKCKDDWFMLNIIPATIQKTNIIFWKVGDYVNIETDIIGKYVERLLNLGHEKKQQGLNVEFLAKHGYV